MNGKASNKSVACMMAAVGAVFVFTAIRFHTLELLASASFFYVLAILIALDRD